MALICEEQSQSLPQVGLKAHVFALQAINEHWIFPRERTQVTEVHIHGLLLILFQLLRNLYIVADLLLLTCYTAAISIDLVCVHLIVWVLDR